MAVCRLELLGGFSLHDADGQERPIASRKGRLLLARLAFAPPGGLPRERLAALLWGDADEARARQSLRQTLSELRRDVALPLDADAQRLWLDAGRCEVDATAFAALAADERPDALERAVALYAGPLLDGLDADDGGDIDDWLRLERQRLEALNRDVFGRLLAHHGRCGDAAALARVAGLAVAFDPADEPAWRVLMGAHRDTGHPRRAAEAFEACRAELRRLLDAEPAPETVAMHRRIQAGSRPEATAAAVSRPEPRRTARLPGIAVMPFEALQGADAGLAAAFGHALSGALARVSGFEATDGTMLFGGVGLGTEAGRRIAHGQGVVFALTGLLEPGRGGIARLTLQLLDCAGSRTLWSRRVDLDDTSPGGRDELIASTVARLEPQLVLHRGAIRADAVTDPLDPWQHVRAASAALFRQGWSEDAIVTATDGFRDAIRVDPGHALAHAHLSLVLALGAKMGLVASDDALGEARAAADRAIELAPTDSEVLGYAGCAIADLGDPRRGEPLLERAVEENPDNPQAWAALGACRLSLAQVDSALQMLERGVRIGPDDYRRAVWLTLLSRGMLHQRRIDEASEAARAAVRSDSRFYPAWLALAAAQFRADKRLQATRSLSQALRIRPGLAPAEMHPWVGPRMAARLAEVWPTPLTPP